MVQAFSLDDVITLARSYNKQVDEDLIRLTYLFADAAHRGQKRLNGEEYIQHCVATAWYLASIQMDDVTICAGLLHDVPDETSSSLADIQKEFGADIAFLVSGVGKLGQLKYRGLERTAENLRKMFVYIAQDIRIVLIKFADRLHNLETISVLPLIKQQRIAREVLEIYAPIADRLGIGYMKGRLEDLAFAVMYPKEYRTVSSLIAPLCEKKEEYLKKVRERVAALLLKNSISEFQIESRVKRLYSAYRKMISKKGELSLDGLYDLVAMRICVLTVAECYAVLGLLHNEWKPLIGSIKDYIAQPKPSGYKALHTTLFCDGGDIVEFQIQTEEMYREARYGVAAHWYYDESDKVSQKITKNIDWLQELLKLHEKTTDHQEYLRSLKLDIFQNRIFVFTPKGDVINLPEHSTSVDFAYYIHSDVGRRCSGARVNGHIVSLERQLESGDVVEILTEKNRKKPSSDWLRFVKTAMARSRIRAQLR